MLSVLTTKLRPNRGRDALCPFMLLAILFACAATVLSQQKFDGKPIQNIVVAFDSGGPSVADEEEYRSVASQVLGNTYSVVRIRDSIEALHKTGKIISVTVEAAETSGGGVELKYLIKRKAQAQKVTVDIQNLVGDPVTEQELLFKLNILDPGTPITEQTLQNNADIILE